MKLCSKCVRSPLPFVMVFSIASLAAFLTWTTLGLSIEETGPRAAPSAGVFLAVGGTMLHYVLACLKRHCRHGKAHAIEAQLHRTAPSRSR